MFNLDLVINSGNKVLQGGRLPRKEAVELPKIEDKAEHGRCTVDSQDVTLEDWC